MRQAMTAKQFRKALNHYGLTQEQAAALFNGTPNRSGRRWAAGGAPFHVALILTLMHRLDLSPDLIKGLGDKWRRQMKTKQTQA
jgi:hypothetical protein